MSSAITVRAAADTDMAAVQCIYAHHVACGRASFEETAPSIAEIRNRWYRVTALGLPYLVAEREAAVLGYSYATPYHSRSGYRYTLEDSVYVDERARGQGVGHDLLKGLLERCESGPWRQMVAVIGDSANIASVALHRRMGFRVVGTLEAIGFKLGRWVDVVIMQRKLGSGSDTDPIPVET